MTVIAWDGTQLAADSLATSGYYRRGVVCKIHTVSGGWAAAAGQRQDILLFVEWLRCERDGERKPKLSEGFAGIVVYSDRVVTRPHFACLRYETALEPWEVPAPHALGSGWSEAVIAMQCGKSAYAAVSMVCDLIIDCAPPIHYVDVETGITSWKA